MPCFYDDETQTIKYNSTMCNCPVMIQKMFRIVQADNCEILDDEAQDRICNANGFP